MINAILIDKTGTLSQTKLKEVKDTELYKKCGFKNTNDFGLRATWKIPEEIYGTSPIVYVTLYAKNKSKTPNFETRYDFPSPCDKDTFFGTCILVAYTEFGNGKQYISLTLNTWSEMCAFMLNTPTIPNISTVQKDIKEILPTLSDDKHEPVITASPTPLPALSSKPHTPQQPRPSSVEHTKVLVDISSVLESSDTEHTSDSDDVSEVSETYADSEESDIVITDIIASKKCVKKPKQGSSILRGIPVISEELTMEEYV
jgi:hypothetical protein